MGTLLSIVFIFIRSFLKNRQNFHLQKNTETLKMTMLFSNFQEPFFYINGENGFWPKKIVKLIFFKFLIVFSF